MTNTPPEWLPDPHGRYDHRFWDGNEWTDQVASAGQAEVDPLGVAPTPEPDLAPPGPTPAPVPAAVLPTDTSRTLRGKGVTGTVEVDDHFVTITRKGAMAKMNYGWTRGEKRIPIDTIAAVQYKKAGMARGYIQFTLAGGNESTRGVMAATQDENSVLFAGGHESEFRAIRDHIEQRIASRQTANRARASVATAPPPDLATQLRALAPLLDEGVLTEEEFAAQKAKLL